MYTLFYGGKYPRIEAWVEVINHQAEIAIKNVGTEQAEFEAAWFLVSTNDKVNLWKYPQSFRCRWEDPTKETVQIPAGKTRRLLISTFEHMPGDWLRFQPLTQEGQPFDVAYYIAGCQPPQTTPEVMFRVTITPSPKAINGPMSKTFVINPLEMFKEFTQVKQGKK